MGNKRNINDIFGKKSIVMSQPDDAWPLPAELIGVEIEVEQFDGDPMRTRPSWAMTQDQSLRNNGVEFVLAAPLGGKQLTAALHQFFDAGYRYVANERTSVHIHVNASDNMTVDQFRNMFALMYVIEPAVFRWADENRKWCGYCCPLTDIAPERVAGLLVDHKGDNHFVKAVKGAVHHDRYYGFNVMSYPKHGTVEFRYFPCTKSKDDVFNWVRFVMQVKKVAMATEDPEAMLRQMNTRDKLDAFLQGAFDGVVAERLKALLDWDDAQGRVHELLAIMATKVDDVKKGAMYAQRSKGFLKLLDRSFPGTAADGAGNGPQGAQAEVVDAYRAMLDRYNLAAAGMAGRAGPDGPAVMGVIERAQQIVNLRQRLRELNDDNERLARDVIAEDGDGDAMLRLARNQERLRASRNNALEAERVRADLTRLQENQVPAAEPVAPAPRRNRAARRGQRV